MKRRLLACAILALSLAALPVLFRAQTPPADPALTAHEWGTFTSIAGRDSHAAEWLPLTGSTDLPSFVEHFQTPEFKGGLAALCVWRHPSSISTPTAQPHSPCTSLSRKG